MTGSEGYFTFPSDQSLRDSWVEKCPQPLDIVSKDGKIAPSKKICYRHFKSEQIKANTRNYSLVPGKYFLSCKYFDNTAILKI